MEEILASIRRIIADDEAKPPPTEKAAEVVKPAPAAAPAPKPAVMNDIPPSKIAPPKPAAEKPAAPPPAVKPAPAPAASNSQDDIDALLAGLDEATAAPEVRAPEPEPEPEPDVLELTDEMAVEMAAPTPAPPPPSFRKVEPRDDVEFAESAAPRPASPPPSYSRIDFDAPPLPPQQPMLAQSTVSAVESAFNSLAHTVLSSNARTLEDLVKEMLRPMLKSWLDDNLPGLVERIVKAEIERVSRGR
jgi:cell pole-organizing protein PopZ